MRRVLARTAPFFCLVVASLAQTAPAGAASQPGQKAPLALDGIAHAALRAGDLKASLEFYQKLGLERSFDFSDAQGVTVYYMKLNDRQFIELYRRNSEAEPIGLMHLCFDTSGIDALFAAYAARGLAPPEPRKARAGNLLFNLRGPEGQTLEYTQYMPGSLHSSDRGKHLAEPRISDHMIRAAIAVTDMEAARTFYTGKLGFTERAGSSPVRLAAPGDSGEEVEIDPAAAVWKPRLTFAVPDVRRAEEELRKRGIAPTPGGTSSVIATDPDGTALVFTVAR